MRRILRMGLIGALLLVGWLASVQNAESSAGVQDRNAWLYKADGKQGWFKKEDGKQWIETTADGGQLAFEEVARTPKYIELFD